MSHQGWQRWPWPCFEEIRQPSETFQIPPYLLFFKRQSLSSVVLIPHTLSIPSPQLPCSRAVLGACSPCPGHSHTPVLWVLPVDVGSGMKMPSGDVSTKHHHFSALASPEEVPAVLS